MISKMKIVASLAMKEADRSGRLSKRARSKVRHGKAVGATRPGIVLVVDDDPSVLRSLNRLISASGFSVKIFAKPSELMASEIPTSNACMVVDIDMPEMTGIRDKCAAGSAKPSAPACDTNYGPNRRPYSLAGGAIGRGRSAV